MEKFSYLDHAWGVFTICETLRCGIGEAWDRVRADIAAGGMRDYNTAGLMPDTDFAAAGALWDALSKGEQQAARDEWYAFIDERDRALALTEAYRAGDRAAFEQVIADWREAN